MRPSVISFNNGAAPANLRLSVDHFYTAWPVGDTTNGFEMQRDSIDGPWMIVGLLNLMKKEVPGSGLVSLHIREPSAIDTYPLRLATYFWP
jgi:hypothetical protein